MTDHSGSLPVDRAPQRPAGIQEALASRLFLALAPRLRREPLAPPPARFSPCELLTIPRRAHPRGLAATWFGAPGGSRGSVLLVPPWLAAGRAYFHRRGRIQALRAAGYGVLAVDMPGFSESGPPAGFFDRDIEDAMRFLARRSSGPVHLWGISSGGYWAHPLLSRCDRIRGAVFEDVSPHLLEWSSRMIPWGWPCYRFFRHVLRDAYRFLDMRSHAAAARLAAAAYVSGENDLGVRPEDTRALARAAGGRWRIVPGAGHLGSIKQARRSVIDLALETFARAERPARDPAGAESPLIRADCAKQERLGGAGWPATVTDG